MGLCVLVFDSSGEPASRPEEMVCGVPCSSGTEFVKGGSALHPKRRLLALRQVLPWKFRQVCSMSVL